jgi:hypothetical protein
VPGDELGPAGGRFRLPGACLTGVILALGVAFVVLRLVTPVEGTQVPPRNQAWAGAGVVAEADPDAALRDGDLVTAVDGIALGDWGDRRAPTLGRAFGPATA